jgi:hypothetical protein
VSHTLAHADMLRSCRRCRLAAHKATAAAARRRYSSCSCLCTRSLPRTRSCRGVVLRVGVSSLANVRLGQVFLPRVYFYLPATRRSHRRIARTSTPLNRWYAQLSPAACLLQLQQLQCVHLETRKKEKGADAAQTPCRVCTPRASPPGVGTYPCAGGGTGSRTPESAWKLPGSCLEAAWKLHRACRLSPCATWCRCTPCPVAGRARPAWARSRCARTTRRRRAPRAAGRP